MLIVRVNHIAGLRIIQQSANVLAIFPSDSTVDTFDTFLNIQLMEWKGYSLGVCL